MIDKQEQIARFDGEADAPREGWTVMRTLHNGEEVWFAKVGTLFGYVIQAGRGWVWILEDEDETLIVEGVSSRRGWAMDACQDETTRRFH